jgi:enoyl-CoA hydratase/carnithine racemase
MTDVLLRERLGNIELFTLNRPSARNAINVQLDHSLVEALEQARLDAAVAAVVLTGAGDRAFCGGADLKELGGKEIAAAPFSGLSLLPYLRARFPKPVIAAINGAAIGGAVSSRSGQT